MGGEHRLREGFSRKFLYEPRLALANMGSFDFASVRFANSRSAQDDTAMGRFANSCFAQDDSIRGITAQPRAGTGSALG